MTKQRLHIRTSKKGKRFKAGRNIGYFAGQTRHEVTRSSLPKGRKHKLMEQKEWIEDTLANVSDLPDERKNELKLELSDVDNQLSHIQGRPAIGVVRGSTDKEMVEGLVSRYADTSSRKPDIVNDIIENRRSLENVAEMSDDTRNKLKDMGVI